MRNLTVVLILFSAAVALGGEIVGVVRDAETGASISGVNVDVSGTNLGAATDAAGQYRILGLTEGEYDLSVSALAYSRKVERGISVPEEGIVTLDILLEPAPIRGEEVVVTSTRRPTPLLDVPDIVLNIPREQIERTEPRDIADIVLYAPGVSVEGGTASGQPYDQIVSIDGLPAHYSIIMMNGARVVSSHWHTGANVNIIPPEALERIEVVKGASSAQYGSDGIGGALNIITARGSAEPRMLFTASGGDRKTQYYSLLTSGPVSDRIVQSSFAGWIKTDGDSVLEPVARLGQLGYEKFTLLNSIDAQITDNLLAKTQMFYLTSHTTFRDTEYESWLITPKLDLEYSPVEDLDIALSAYYTRWDGEINTEKNEIAQPQATIGFGGLKSNYILAGGEFTYRNFMRSKVLERSQTSAGAFVQDEWTPSEAITVLGALRLDKPEGIGAVVTPKISALYRPIDMMDIRLSVGRGFRAPTVQDLYEDSYGHGSYRRTGNPELKPEFSTGLTGGIELRPLKGLSVLLDGYYTALTDMIAPAYDHTDTVDSAAIAVFVRRNIYSAKIYGGELKIAYNFFRSFELECAANITHNENEETGTALPYYPGMTIAAKLSGREPIFSRLDLGGFVGLNSVSGRKIWNWNNIAEEEELEDYLKLDAGLNLRWGGKYELFGTVDNILGEEIVTYEDAFLRLAGIPRIAFGIRIGAF